jgi:hypothetical protein
MSAPIRDYGQLRSAITARRKQLALTPEELDARAGLPRRTTRRLESGGEYVGERNLAQLLIALACRLYLQTRPAK